MNNLLNVLKKELREMFRDKKTMSLMLIVPFMIPLLVLGMSYLFDSEVNQKQDEYKKIGFSYKLSSEEKEIAKNLKIKIYEDNIDSLKKKYENEKIEKFINIIYNGFVMPILYPYMGFKNKNLEKDIKYK